MTSQEFIAKLSPTELNRLSTIFEYMAISLTEARLRTGIRLIDLTDVKMWLLELSIAAKLAEVGDSTKVPNAAERRPVSKVMLTICPRCGHEHQGTAECGEDMGGGRICRCELEVRV